MTYYHSTTTYEFTAFAEDALGGHVSCGTQFSMPQADTCITVKDNDRFLSGDRCHNENADDWSYQTASIEQEGAEAGNGGQIYAESYWWVSDQHGNWYVMIEIEQEGSSDDYFTFYTGYGYTVPPEGADLTVGHSCNVSGNWIDFKCLDSGEKIDFGSISGTVFCDEDCDGINGDVTIVPGHDYTIEAEDMNEYGFQTVHGAQASGGQLVKLKCFGGSGELCTDFNGKTGTYDIKIRVQDESDGQSTIKLLVNGHFVTAIELDRDSDGLGSNDGGFSTFVVPDVELKHGDDISLAVRGSHGELVRIDKIDLEGEDTTIYTPEPTKEGVLIKLLNADGTAVRDAAGDPVTTMTDAHGNYSFDKVEVGHYKIMGVAPDGTEFTIQDAGNDDTIDSDVNETGTSDVVSVKAGETTDIDLGVCENKPPEATPDSGKGCADTEIRVDLADNISDPEDDVLSIVSVGGVALTDGGPAVEVEPDVFVFLDGTELVFDGSAAYADLGIGDEEKLTVSYTIEDDFGNTASSTVEVTFCGLYETVEELGDSLPAGTVTFQVVDNNLPFGSSNDAYSLQFLDAGGDARFEGTVFTEAYCVAAFDSFLTGESFADAPVLTATLSLIDDNTAFGSGILGTLADANPEIDDDELDNLINYILNTDWESQGYTDDEVQGAIWGITDSAVFVPNGTEIPDPDALEILNDAIANGQDFVAGEGDIVGVLVEATPEAVALGHEQPFLVGVLWEECIC